MIQQLLDTPSSVIMYSMIPPIDRFFSKIEINESTGCWEWKAFIHKGYARLNVGGKIVEAHRWIYELLIGIPAGLQLDHLCRVRHCVNPDHLEPVTSHENTMRGESIVAKRASQTRCIRGHLLSGNNVSIVNYRGTHRRCLKCHAIRETARRLRRKHDPTAS